MYKVLCLIVFFACVRGSAAEEIATLRSRAESGNAQAQFSYGDYLFKGTGTKKDPVEAVKWYQKAAEQGLAEAQAALGTCYAKGVGITKDIAEAVKWSRKAADQGCASGQNRLGVCYETGRGVTKDPVEAVKWYQKAAEQGLAGAQCNLGDCYFRGTGVTEDAAEAMKWYQKAAEQGDAHGQCWLGYFYQKGLTGPVNPAEAVKWYRKAAEQGDTSAQEKLGWCYQSGDGVRRNLDEAVKWYRKAAELGNADAQASLGIIYGSGNGVPKDEVEGYAWHILAADSGSKLAKDFWTSIKPILDHEVINRAQQRSQELSKTLASHQETLTAQTPSHSDTQTTPAQQSAAGIYEGSITPPNQIRRERVELKSDGSVESHSVSRYTVPGSAPINFEVFRNGTWAQQGNAIACTVRSVKLMEDGVASAMSDEEKRETVFEYSIIEGGDLFLIRSSGKLQPKEKDKNPVLKRLPK